MKTIPSRLLIIFSGALLMLFVMTSLASAQTTALPTACEINEVADDFVEVYCTVAYTFDPSVYLGVTFTGQDRADGDVYQVTASTSADGFAVVDSFPAGILADGASDGLTVDLNLYVVQGSVTTPQDVDEQAFSAATLSNVDLVPRIPETLQAIPDGSDDFYICPDGTRGVANDTQCETTAVTVSAVETATVNPFLLIVISLATALVLVSRTVLNRRN